MFCLINSSNLRPLLVLLLVLGSGCEKRVLRVEGSDMQPTIKYGEEVVLDTYAYSSAPPARWDVIAFQAPEPLDLVCKRVVALPLETVSCTSSGIVVDGNLLSMPVTLSNIVYAPLIETNWPRTISFPYLVPANHYFVVGDSWTNSFDSRHYGAIAKTSIVGRIKNK